MYSCECATDYPGSNPPVLQLSPSTGLPEQHSWHYTLPPPLVHFVSHHCSFPAPNVPSAPPQPCIIVALSSQPSKSTEACLFASARPSMQDLHIFSHSFAGNRACFHILQNSHTPLTNQFDPTMCVSVWCGGVAVSARHNHSSHFCLRCPGNLCKAELHSNLPPWPPSFSSPLFLSQ